MDIEVIGMQTTRERDGLAMSSRNVYLKPPEREAALSLSRSLVMAKEMYEGGERDAGRILREVGNVIRNHPYTNIDYAKICDTAAVKDVARIETEAVLALAVWVGKTRLIDNYVFGEPLDIPTTRG
jgi:pantoate--beta-alanine ligase